MEYRHALAVSSEARKTKLFWLNSTHGLCGDVDELDGVPEVAGAAGAVVGNGVLMMGVSDGDVKPRLKPTLGQISKEAVSVK